MVFQEFAILPWRTVEGNIGHRDNDKYSAAAVMLSYECAR